MGALQNKLHDPLYLSFLLQRYDRRYARKFSRIVVTTEDERQEFLKLSPDLDIQVWTNGVDFDLLPPRTVDAGGYKLIYVGAMDAFHNIDAAIFFAREILPKIQNQYANTTFTIAVITPTA